MALSHKDWLLTIFIYQFYFYKCQKMDEKKSKEDKQTLEELH